MAIRNEFLHRNAWVTRFGHLDLVPSPYALASRVSPNSPLRAPNQKAETQAVLNYRFRVRACRCTSLEAAAYSVSASACKPRGIPKISRRIIASRKPDFDPTRVAIF